MNVQMAVCVHLVGWLVICLVVCLGLLVGWLVIVDYTVRNE